MIEIGILVLLCLSVFLLMAVHVKASKRKEEAFKQWKASLGPEELKKLQMEEEVSLWWDLLTFSTSYSYPPSFEEWWKRQKK